MRWPICDLLIMAKQPTDRPQLEEHACNTEDETFRQVHVSLICPLIKTKILWTIFSIKCILIVIYNLSCFLKKKNVNHLQCCMTNTLSLIASWVQHYSLTEFTLCIVFTQDLAPNIYTCKPLHNSSHYSNYKSCRVFWGQVMSGKD